MSFYQFNVRRGNDTEADAPNEVEVLTQEAKFAVGCSDDELKGIAATVLTTLDEDERFDVESTREMMLDQGGVGSS